MMLRGVEDPFHIAGGASGLTTVRSAAKGRDTILMPLQPAPGPQMAQFLEQANLQQNLNKALLRLTRVLDQSAPQVLQMMLELIFRGPSVETIGNRCTSLAS